MQPGTVARRPPRPRNRLNSGYVTGVLADAKPGCRRRALRRRSGDDQDACRRGRDRRCPGAPAAGRAVPALGRAADRPGRVVRDRPRHLPARRPSGRPAAAHRLGHRPGAHRGEVAAQARAAAAPGRAGAAGPRAPGRGLPPAPTPGTLTAGAGHLPSTTSMSAARSPSSATGPTATPPSAPGGRRWRPSLGRPGGLGARRPAAGQPAGRPPVGGDRLRRPECRRPGLRPAARLDLFAGPSRARFRDELAVDDASWLRGRGWALFQAVVALPYYWDTNPGMVRQASHAVAQVLADRSPG